MYSFPGPTNYLYCGNQDYIFAKTVNFIGTIKAIKILIHSWLDLAQLSGKKSNGNGVELQKTEEGDQLLQLDNLEGWGIYDASLADDVGRDKAVEAALDMIIEEIIDRTTASW